MTPDEILNQLNPEQARAASTIDGPVLVLAGAGTGKTRVITYRIAYMLARGIPPESILGLTFTNKAAREMRERLAGLVPPSQARAVTLGTFHAFCVRVLRREIGKLGYLGTFTIADDSDQQGLYKQAAAELGWNKGDVSLPELAARISEWKNRLLTATDARDAADNDFDIHAAALYAKYQSMLELQNMIDFDDMLLLVFQLFEKYPEVLERYREHYCYLLVDEYQDTNDAQFTIVKMLAGERCNLCVVGDDDQSIYGWRGANIENILHFPDLFPGTTEIKLEQNYRSTGKILHAANAVIGANKMRHQKRLWSNLGEGSDLTRVCAEDGEAEAEFIAGMIRQEMGENLKRSYKDFAVLYRSNHLSRQLEQALRQGGIPYRLVGGQEFYKRKEIKDAVAYLKLLVNPHEDQSLLRILATPPRGLAKKAVDQLKFQQNRDGKPMLTLLGSKEFQEALGGKGAASAAELDRAFADARAEFSEPGRLAAKVTAFLKDVGYLGGLQKMYKDIDDAMKRRENVDEFISAIAQYEAKAPEPPTLAEYLESFALLEENDRTSDDGEAAEGVTLSTIHAAKGLEFPVVFLVAMERDTFPHERAVGEGTLDEELRLFYVAITRAREKLFLTHADERYYRGFRKSQLESPFLELLPEEIVNEETPKSLIRQLSKDEMKAAFAKIFEILEK